MNKTLTAFILFKIKTFLTMLLLFFLAFYSLKNPEKKYLKLNKQKILKG